MTAARKISQNISKELQRHVQRQTKSRFQPGKGSFNDSTNGTSSKKLRTFFGCVGFVGLTASLPLWFMKWIEPLNERDGVLTQAQIRRGAFNNSGSRDAGKDPNWDFRKGVRKKDEEYTRLFAQDDPNKIEHGDDITSDLGRS